MGNMIKAVVGKNAKKIRTAPLYQYDYGQILKIEGIELPTAYQVHFSNDPMGSSTTSIGNSDGVAIPDTYLTSGDTVYAWLYLHTGEDDGETVLMIEIPVNRRAEITNETPSTSEQSEIDQLINELNAAVDDAEDSAEDAADSAEDAEAWAAGTRGGEAVASTDPAYHNNAKYYAEQEHQYDPDVKIDKVTTATSGNFASFDNEGGLQDSGKKASDFLTQHQDISGKANLTVAAPAFAEATANDAGSFVTYEGVVYLLLDGHTANTTWANTTKTATNLGDQLAAVKRAIQDIESDLYQGETETYTGEIAVIDGQTAGASIGITPGTGVINIYHSKKNLFNLFNRTKGTISEYSASNPRAFSETEYYNGFLVNGENQGDGYGVLEYITDGIATFQGESGGGGGKGTIFPFKIPAERTYTLSMNIYGEVKVMYYNSSGVYQSYESAMLSTTAASDKTFTFTPPAGTYWTVILFQNHKTRNHQYKNVMLVEGESSETYEECSFEKLANSITSVTAYEGKNKIWSDAGSFSISGEVSVLELMDERMDGFDVKTAPLENDVIHRNLDVLPAVHACVGYGKSQGGVLNSEEGWGMLITTDVHAREQVMQNAIDYFNAYPFLHIGMCLGDMPGSNYAQTDGTWYTGRVNQATKPWYTVLGNHDGGNSTDGSISATVADQFTKWIAPTLETMGMPSLTVPYYAVHNSTYGISAIFLDCYDVPDTKSGDDFVVSRGTSAYSQNQIDWFIDELNNVPDGNHLLIFQHGYTGASTKETCAWSQAFKVVNDISSYGELIPDIVNAWVTGGTLSDTYTTSVTGLSSITVSADFTSRGTGVFAGYVVGHYHRDLIAHSTKYSYQKIIALCCTADGLWQGENSDLPRVENMKSQDCLTVLCVNKTHKTVNLARVGANWTVSMTQRIGYAVSYDNS